MSRSAELWGKLADQLEKWKAQSSAQMDTDDANLVRDERVTGMDIASTIDDLIEAKIQENEA